MIMIPSPSWVGRGPMSAGSPARGNATSECYEPGFPIVKLQVLVVAGLDPAIHPLSKDGCAGQSPDGRFSCVPGAAQQPRAARSAVPRVVRCRPGTAPSSVPAAPGLGACGGPGSAVHHDALRASRCTASGTQSETQHSPPFGETKRGEAWLNYRVSTA